VNFIFGLKKFGTLLAILVVVQVSSLYAQTPGGVSTGLNVWLKANNGVEEAVGDPAENGDAITRWLDNSGNGRHYNSVVGPTFRTAIQNFNPMVEILSGGFDAPAGSELSTDWTTFFISKKLASDNNGRIFDGHIGNYLWAHWGNYTNSIFINSIPSNYNSGIATTVGIEDLHLHSYKRESTGGTLEARVDGTSLTTFGSSNSGSGVRIDINQGAYSGETSDSQVGEMIIYNSALTALEVVRVETYLAIKYGLTLTHNYVASNGTTIWDATTNAAYHFDVTGIGRDDNSGLNQQMSRSINTDGAVLMDKSGAFSNDRDFIIWGNNNAMGKSGNVPPAYVQRSSRIWKVATLGTPGTVNFNIDLSQLAVPNTGNAADYALLIDDDVDFSADATAHTTGASLVGNILSFTGVGFNNNDFFSIAVANISVPGGAVGDLAVWLKADNGVEEAAADPAEDGDAVSRWLDKSGYANDYTVVAGPSYKTNALNFNPTVEILSGGFNAPVGAALSSDWSIFFVAKKLASDNDGRLFDGHTGNFLWGYHDTHERSIYINGNPNNYNSGIAVNNGGLNLSLQSYVRNNSTTNIEARANGQSLATFAGTNTANGIQIDINQGAFSTQSSHSQIGEVIIYRTALSATDVNKIESYLGIKYGLTLSHNYLASDGSLLWDMTANASYHNAVAGIGRDDLNGLDQRKSKSLVASSALTIDKGAAFGSDKDYLLWGSNNNTGTSANAPGGFVLRSNRIWKTSVLGTPGSVTTTIDLSQLGIPNTGSASDYVLLIDTDTDFSTGATLHTTGVMLVGNNLTFTSVNLASGNFISVAAANVSLPGGVAGSVFWVKADAGVTGTTNVSSWADQSGTNNNATQGTMANQPSLVNPDLNFNPTIDFSDQTDVMQITTPPANLNTTVFSVAVPAPNISWRTMFRGVAGDHPIIVESGGTRLGYYDNDNVGFKYSGFNWTQGTPSIVGLEMRAGDVNFRKDGTQGASIATINLAGLNLDYFGNYLTGTQRFGKIGETIIFNTPSPLTTTEKEKIESYMAIKYGITLSHNYLNSTAATIWNTTTNAGYNNDIAGIGRDDVSGLNQQKSLSISADGAVTIDKGGAFGTDQDYLLWGNNDGTGLSTNAPPTFVGRSSRIWKVVVSGTPGNVNFSINLATLGLPNTGNVADYALLIDSDTDFSVGATTHTTGASLVGSVLSFTGVSFTTNNFFSIAAMNISIPGGVAGLVFWVKADAGVTGTTNVSAWADQSGTGNNATQGTMANQPSLINPSLNFNPTIDFSDASDVMQLASPPVNTNATVFSVAVPAPNTSWRTMFRGATSDHPIIIETGSTRLGYYDGDGGGFKFSGFNWVQNVPMIVGLEMRTGDVNFRKDGTQGASINSINLAGLSLDYFGNYQLGNQRFGKIAETMIFNTPSPMTATEKEKIESYMAIKYGVTLSHNYLTSSGSIIWNTTTNAGYNNDIAGIGRDDVSGLSQRKSLSINTDGAVTIDKGSSFASDKDFLLWGNNDGTGLSTNTPPTFSGRSARIWKVATAGTPGAVTFSINLATLSIPNTGLASDYTLLIDTDTDFSSGSTIHTTGASLVGSVLSFTGVNFNNNNYFSIAAMNVSIPGGVSGAVFWVKADAGVTGIANVSAWADQSGTSNNATQGTMANQPALVTNDLNFNPSINFSGSTQIMTLASPPANLNATIFAIGKPGVNTSWRTMFRGATNDHPIIVQTGGTTLGYFDGDNVGFKTSGFTWLQNEPALVALELRSGNVNFRKNGVQGASIATINLAGLNLAYFGNYQGNNQQFGKIEEVIIYNTAAALTSVEKEQIESYLGLKYGITLSHNYLSGLSSVVWDATANATFHNNVTGIGKDTKTGLDQKQSKSQANGAVVTIGLGTIATDNASNGNSFSADQSFFIFGNNSAALNSGGVTDIGTTVNAEVIKARLNRTWRAVETGAIGNLKVRFDLSTVPGRSGTPGDNDLQYVRLLVDADGTFATGATSISPTSFNNVTDIVEFDHDFTAGTGLYFTIGSVDDINAALPIELISLTVNQDGEGNAVVSWTTASELNNQYFTVERSKEGKQWEKIASLPGAGTTTTKHEYSFIDLYPYSNISYYRLRQTDYDGTSTISKIVSLFIEAGSSSISIYPNPATDEFVIEGDQLENATLTIANMLGQQFPIQQKIERRKIITTTSHLPRGTYIVIIRNGSNVVWKKIVLH
jgi:hypothetical protein